LLNVKRHEAQLDLEYGFMGGGTGYLHDKSARFIEGKLGICTVSSILLLFSLQPVISENMQWISSLTKMLKIKQNQKKVIR
jgi:hypothetical protein